MTVTVALIIVSLEMVLVGLIVVVWAFVALAFSLARVAGDADEAMEAAAWEAERVAARQAVLDEQRREDR